jgi:hypothetical protein
VRRSCPPIVGVDEVALRKKISTSVQIKIDCNSDGEVMVDEDDDVVVEVDSGD